MILLWIITTPFVGGILCHQFEFVSKKSSRWIALFLNFLILLVSLILLQQSGLFLQSDITLKDWKIEYLISWIPRFGINIHLELDGLSLLMIILTELIGIIAVLCSWKESKINLGLFHLSLMWIIGSAIGIFISLDMFLFFFFWELMLIPTYFLIILSGHQEYSYKTRIITANKFFVYNQISGFGILVVFLSLAIMHYKFFGIWTFSYKRLIFTPMSINTEYILMFILFISFAIKMPVVPLHGWLPDTHSQVPTSGSIDLVGIVIKTSAYGMLKLIEPLFPNASHHFAPIAMSIGVISIFYGAFVTFAQTDIKRFIAYSSISNMGFILIAIYSNNYISYHGAVIQMISHSLSTTGMLLVCGQLYERLNTRDIRKMGGLWNKLKFIPSFSLFFIASILGLPGTGNFTGEVISFFGNFSVSPKITLLSTLGIVLTSIYSLLIMKNIFYCKSNFCINNLISNNLSLMELCYNIILVILIILIGLFPQIIMNISNETIVNIQNHYANN